ncbi:RidA family protein [Bradyrhizobium tropiciagri]|uniref:RidA family protein n=1 Tax=Bradyrhizobium tropiciagri TaxID=312253 RepID=UPI001BA8184B|nr:Rid family hydrolase [Bradyrhizobium tropiciagri]MBR0896692.1 RidA family protein [Bradyrhizobium tropiciagri]
MITRKSPDVDYVSKEVLESFGIAQVVRYKDTVYFSGVAPVQGGESGVSIVGETMAEQLQFTLRVIDDLLKSEGLDRSRLLYWDFYATDMAAMVEAFPKTVVPWVGKHLPANTMVEVKGFVVPGQMLEVTAIAAIG